MKVSHKEWPILVVGDIAAFVLALFLTLLIRYADVPSEGLFIMHLYPFSFLFLVSIFIFFTAGLYEKHTSFLKRELPGTVIAAQIVNVVLAATFFFFIPYFGIAPKTNLAIYLTVSSVLVMLWRFFLFPLFEFKNREEAIIIGSGKELLELTEEINANRRYRLKCVQSIDLAKVGNPNDVQAQVLKKVMSGEVSTIIADTNGAHADMLVPLFYNLTFVQSQVHIVNFSKVYEEAFDRIQPSQVSHEWLLENLTLDRRPLYETAKRLVDIIFSIPILVVTALVTPLVFVVVRLEGPGPLFILQERMGQNGKKIRVRKFRTMTANEQSAWIGETTNKVTKVGAFLRKTSIDELPQVLAVLKGDVSFIGPRSDVVGLAERLAEAIQFYNARYKVVPGISGWAQINQRYAPGKISPQSIEESRLRLAYDLYYVKHRSLLLDLSIALRTIKTLITRLIPQYKKKHDTKH